MTILIVEGTALLRRKQGNISVIDEGKNTLEVPVPDLELLVIVGERVRVTSSALLMLLSQGIPIAFISSKSDAYGVLFDIVQIGITDVRAHQYKCFEDEKCRVKYGSAIIESKLRGFYNVLRYEYKYYKESMSAYDYAKTEILETIDSLKSVNDSDELRVLEAKGSKVFWGQMTNLIPGKYGFSGREPRKGDVINSSVDFIYAVIYGIATKSLVVNGLDPFYGMLHVKKSGRLSLVYDFSEIFKPMAIHAILQASRKAALKTFRGSRMLKPKTIEVLMEHLYYRLSKESERIYKRSSIWMLPMRESAKLKDALIKHTDFKPYVYDPTNSGS